MLMDQESGHTAEIGRLSKLCKPMNDQAMTQWGMTMLHGSAQPSDAGEMLTVLDNGRDHYRVT